MSIKLLHLSDIHLGSKVNFLGEKASQHRETLWRTFEVALKRAVEAKVQFVVLSGDVFDTPFPAQAAVQRFCKLVEPLAVDGIYTIILPGNHDRLETGSVWLEFKVAAPIDKYVVVMHPDYHPVGDSCKLTVLDHDLSLVCVEFPQLDTAFYARPSYTQRSSSSPLQGIAGKMGSQSHKVVVAHGGVELGNSIAGSGRTAGNYMITREEIGSLGADYLALGDWHGTLDVSVEDVTAWYPGALSLLARDQENSGYGLLVEIQNSTKTKVEKVRLGELSAINKVYNLDQLPISHLEKELESLADEKLCLTLTLSGQKPSDVEAELDVVDLEQRLQDKFYSLKIVDKSNVNLEDYWQKSYPEGSIPHEFIEQVKQGVASKNYEPEFAQKLLALGLGVVNKRPN